MAVLNVRSICVWITVSSELNVLQSQQHSPLALRWTTRNFPGLFFFLLLPPLSLSSTEVAALPRLSPTASTQPHCLLSLSHFSFLFKYRLHSSCSCSHSFPTARRAAERLCCKPGAGLFRRGAHYPHPLTHTNKQNPFFLNRPASCIAIVTALVLFLIQSRTSSGFTFMSSRVRKQHITTICMFAVK